MFERYTERARRVIFFSRFEATQSGSAVIEAGHMLLGLLRENPNVLTRFLATPTPPGRIEAEIRERMTIQEKSSTWIDTPLSMECKRILASAAEEAEALDHRHIGTEHILLGMLREDATMASQILHDHGIDAGAVRHHLSSSGPPVPMPALPPQAECVPDADTAKRIAEAIWLPVYGAEEVARQKPVQAHLMGNVWYVRGSPADSGHALIGQISRHDGRILKMGHE